MLKFLNLLEELNVLRGDGGVAALPLPLPGRAVQQRRDRLVLGRRPRIGRGGISE